MAWKSLPENYTDAVWSGPKRYSMINNEDGTVSFQDVTVYSHKENSFFGAKDANRMNQALNIIMAMVENGTDLYTAFLEYFSTQKELFESNADLKMADLEAYMLSCKAEGDEIVEDLKTDYREEITSFETAQEQVFNTWFGFIKNQLGEDVAGNLQNQIIELREYSDSTFLPYNGGTMTGSIDMNGHAIKGLNVPTENDQAANMGFVNQQVRKAAPRNLLDNSYFANPVNQRGSTNASALNFEHFIDRWLGYGAGASFSVSANKIVITNDGTATCGLVQRISADNLIAGKTYTLAMKAKVTGNGWYLSYGINYSTNSASSKALSSGIEKVHIFTFVLPESTDGLFNFRIRSSAVVGAAEIEWAALYEGEYTAETLPAYQPKGYGAELVECRRYFRRYTADTEAFFLLCGTASNRFYGPLALDTPMRAGIVPTITYKNINAYPYITGESREISSMTVEGRTKDNSILYLRGVMDANVERGVVCIRILAGGHIDIDMDW